MNRPPWPSRVDAAEEAIASIYPLTIGADGATKKRERLRPKCLTEIISAPAPTWRIVRVLPTKGLGVLYGDSQSGKTFLGIDMCMALARDVQWFGRRVKRCGVLYIAAEGHLGLRLRAYIKHNDIGAEALADQFRVVDSAVNLLDPRADLPELLEEMNAAARAMGNVGLVVIDTLNRIMPGGDENQSNDMGAVITSAKRIEEALGCLVLFVHHSGKNVAAGARGHSSLRAACDVELEVVDGPGARTMKITKLRDGETGTQFSFRLGVVDLGPDLEGGPEERVTSCVVLPATEDAATDDPKLGVSADIAIRTLRDLVYEQGQQMPDTSTIPAGVRAVKLDAWRSRFLTAYGEKSEGSKDSQLRLFRKAKDELLGRRLIGLSDPYVWAWR